MQFVPVFHLMRRSEDELIKKIADVHFIGIRSRTQLTEHVLSHAKKLNKIEIFRMTNYM